MLTCVMCIRDEEYYLPSFFDHIRDYVDAFVILDDGSEDNTINIVKKEPKVLDIIRNPKRASEEFQEGKNREIVLNRAKELGATWFFCADPDERFELNFLKNLKEITKTKTLYGLKVREMWDDYKTYRVDGVWGNKKKFLLFPVTETMTFTNKQYHGPWFPTEFNKKKKILLDYNLYHLRMIRPQDRIARKERYKKLDPEQKFQRIGYDYLTDEEGLKLEAIKKGKEYNFSTLPFAFKESNNIIGFFKRIFSK